ncbi:hypothetical protein QJS04_geneDACA020333 [Acorus gramineus]|uniref:Uncharacterized protein n=1 Tax=Acorus gramineus TaxID=55184 RepID=A0AAV9A922_ACOGR|nr:hypothetical protein QJS04_geneDACA020333 [Acorus gramineus]
MGMLINDEGLIKTSESELLMTAIAEFLKPFQPPIDAHVVDLFESWATDQALEQIFPCNKGNIVPPLVSAGLYASGDLSVNMLRSNSLGATESGDDSYRIMSLPNIILGGMAVGSSDVSIARSVTHVEIAGSMLAMWRSPCPDRLRLQHNLPMCGGLSITRIV